LKNTYKAFVRWSHANKEYLSEFSVETEHSESWLRNDIARSYNQQFEYTIDGRLLGIEVERIVENGGQAQ